MKRKRTLYRVELEITNPAHSKNLQTSMTYRTYSADEAGQRALAWLDKLAGEKRVLRITEVEPTK